MTKNFQMVPEEALKLGNQMIDLGIMHHVVFEHNFKDKPLFYRFQVSRFKIQI